MSENHQLAVLPPSELVRQSTDIAGLCKEIVVKSAMDIQGRKYVRVEGWQSIATAHGCVASARDVERVDGGFRAIGEVRRMHDGAVIAQAEGFVGEDEPTWFGGPGRNGQPLPKRPDYAIRAMAQTRAISRACRSAFAHVVVLMDAGLSTTPAEEVPHGGFNDDAAIEQRQQHREAAEANASSELEPLHWEDVVVHFGKHKGKRLGDLEPRSIGWFQKKWEPQPYNGKINPKDAALKKAVMEMHSTPVEKGSQPPPADGNDDGDEIPMFSGPHHKNLAGLLAFNNFEQGKFMEWARSVSLIPQNKMTFGQMPDEMAAKFTEDFDIVINGMEAGK